MIRNLGTEPTLDLRPLIQMVGMRQVIDQFGLGEVLKVVSAEQVVAQMGVDWLISGLTPEQLQELKRRLP